MYHISDIAILLGAHCVGDEHRQVDWLLTDSRSLRFPETTLFFALRTPHGDGHRFLSELYGRGVRSFVVQHIPSAPMPGAAFLQVPDTLVALQRLAERHRERFGIPVIGITGSNGKTTVKEWLHQLLSPHFTITRSPRSYNSQLGVPLSVWGLGEQTQIGIFEAGISLPGEMASLERIIQPTIGVFTSLGEAHQENFQSMEQKCMEKLQLFRHARVLVYPADDAVLCHCIEQMQFDGTLIPCRAAGSALQTNQALCRAVCQHLGMDMDWVDHRLQHLEPVAMRLEVRAGVRGCTIINDAYSNDLSALDIAIDFMNRRPEAQGTSRTLILSDILQSGIPPRQLYTQVADMLSQRGVDTLLAVGPDLQAHRSCFSTLPIQQEFFTDTDSLLQSSTFSQLRDRMVLLKGARTFHFERLMDALEQQEHETVLEVNHSALLQNLRHHRSHLHADTRIICMVKADAYGAGAVEVARTLQDSRVDYLAVAVADEGVALRRAGITTGIMVMNPEMSTLHTLFRHHLEPEVYSFRLLEALIRTAESQGITDSPIHIKLDTGMHRMGFHPTADMQALLQCLHGQTALLPRSVFSHFVGSDSAEFDHFSAHQYHLFEQGADLLQAGFRHRILRHMCNSAGILRFPDRQQDMVRLGLGLYGIDSRDGSLLSPVLTLRTTILQIHQVPAGESVGYSRRSILQRDSRIASLPIGYADGLDRRLGCGVGYCMVNGQPAPYVGSICMDVCMVDVTDIPCSEGDSAVIFGTSPSPTTLADAMHTIPYEVITGISPRVRRLHYME